MQFGQDQGREALGNSVQCWIDARSWPLAATSDGIVFRRRWRGRLLNSALGPIRIQVPSYEAVGQDSLRPVEAALGLRDSLTPLAALRCAELAAHLPFKLSSELLGDLTPLEISASTVPSGPGSNPAASNRSQAARP